MITRAARNALKVAVIMAVIGMSGAAQAQSAPLVSPGVPTQGAAVGLLTEGIDYRDPAVAAKLARDGEGDLIGWSARTQDRRPFLRDGADTALVPLAFRHVAPVQVDPLELAHWHAALEFIARAPMRVVVVTAPLRDTRSREAVFAQMAALANTLFILPAVVGEAMSRPANVISIAALPARSGDALPRLADADLVLGPPATVREMPGPGGSPPRDAREAAIMLPELVTCVDLTAVRSAARFKQRLIALAQAGPGSAAPLLSACR